MLPTFTLLCFCAVFYAYFGYPIVLFLLPKRSSVRASRADGAPPSITIIITVRNEAKVIREKLQATLALVYAGDSVGGRLRRPDGRVQLIVASDASDDGTDQIVEEYHGRGVRLVRLAARGGKEKAQHAAVQAASGDIVVFTDAKVRLQQDALDCFSAYFSDPEVGAVSSIDRVEASAGSSSGEGFYVRYEMALRSLESRFNSLVGLSGSCFAVRRTVCADMATDIPSDFALLIEARRQRLRGVHGADVSAFYKAVKSEREEFQRKVRTVLRGITALWKRREILNPLRYGLFAWQVWSHKVFRWLVPWCFLGGLLGAASSSFGSFSFLGLFLLALLVPLLAAVGVLRPDLKETLPVKIPTFFVVSNAAVAVAGIYFLLGRRSISWDPSQKGG